MLLKSLECDFSESPQLRPIIRRLVVSIRFYNLLKCRLMSHAE